METHTITQRSAAVTGVGGYPPLGFVEVCGKAGSRR
jgi:hypothetical protein